MTTFSTLAGLLAASVAGLGTTLPVPAETRVTDQPAKAASSLYPLAVQIAEATKAPANRGLILAVQPSQRSVQNAVV